MIDIYIYRNHKLGLHEIRKIAFTWAELAEEQFGIDCIYQEGKILDELFFKKTGIEGYLLATSKKIEIQVELGIFYSTFQSSIENEISRNLDLLLSRQLKRKN